MLGTSRHKCKNLQPTKMDVCKMSWNKLGVFLSILITNVFGYPPSSFNDDGITNSKGAFLPWDDYRHNPSQMEFYPDFQVPAPLPLEVNGTELKIPNPLTESPDYRLPEPPYYAHKIKFYGEMNRYYRITPRQHIEWWQKAKKSENPAYLQCYCVCVFKRLTPLAMGAVITTRHIMTTAVATDLVVRKYRHKFTLENILGAWYETSHSGSTNSVIYTTPVRIHYHPRWAPPERTNRSFPFPCVFDVAVWAAERTFFGGWWARMMNKAMVVLCNRCAPGTNKKGWVAPTLGWDDLTIFVGVHMVMDIGREPFPWFKYAIRTRTGKRQPCPKSEWGWFHCIEHVGQYPKWGCDNGSPLHVSYEGKSTRYDGMAGINSLSLRLRSRHPVSYFTVLERHPILNFLYSTYCGRLPYAFLDNRFNNTQWKAPQLKAFLNNQLQPTDLAHKTGEDWAKKKLKYSPIWWR